MIDSINEIIEYISKYAIFFTTLASLYYLFGKIIKFNKLDQEDKKSYYSLAKNTLVICILMLLCYSIFSELKGMQNDFTFYSQLSLENQKLLFEEDFMNDKIKQKQLLDSLIDIDDSNIQQALNSFILLQSYVQIILILLIFCVIKIWMNRKKIIELESKLNKKIKNIESRIHPNAQL